MQLIKDAVERPPKQLHSGGFFTVNFSYAKRSGSVVFCRLSPIHFTHRPCCGVNFLVLMKVGISDAGCPTLIARMKPGCSVISLMHFKVGTVAKALPTFITLVMCKYIFTDKGLPIQDAHKRPFPNVSFLMLNKYVSAAKGFRTFTARVRFYSSVKSLVLNKAGFSNQGFLTFSTLVRP